MEKLMKGGLKGKVKILNDQMRLEVIYEYSFGSNTDELSPEKIMSRDF